MTKRKSLPGQSTIRYGGSPADSFLRFIGPIHGTVLDIGSGEGAWAPQLRRAGAVRLTAIEPDEASAQVASSRYDLVVREPVELAPVEVVSEADLIVLADCLEHLPDPWSTVAWLRHHARPDCRLLISIPNFRFVGLLAPVLLTGRFEYSDNGGLLDRGHLRWFTRSSLERTLRAAGWTPDRWSGDSGTGIRSSLNRVTGGAAAELLCHQLYMSAVNTSATGPSRDGR